jgi:phosphoglycerate kinase
MGLLEPDGRHGSAHGDVVVTPNLRTLDGLDVSGKRVVVRADLNVPMIGNLVADYARIRSLIPTLSELTDAGARLVVLSHFGRPNGRVVADCSLERLRQPLEQAANYPVRFVPTDWNEPVDVGGADETILLMENTRFHPGEEANDPNLSRRLAALGEVFVNDAFSASHRAHASTEGIARLLPSFAGRSMQAELAALDSALGDPERPIGAFVGGAKISSKLAILENLVKRVDLLFVGGGMANTFLYAQGIPVGRSLCEHQMSETALRILDQAKSHGCDLILPSDAITADKLEKGMPFRIVDVKSVPDNEMILDIGPASVAEVTSRLAGLKTLLWNGPFGAFEIEPFERGTYGIAKAAARLTRAGDLLSVAGGGDTLSALGGAGVIEDFSHVSTAGGAFLEWLEGRELPGVKVLLTDFGARS